MGLGETRLSSSFTSASWRCFAVASGDTLSQLGIFLSHDLTVHLLHPTYYLSSINTILVRISRC